MSVLSDGSAEQESFPNFFECWIVEQDQHLQDLISASIAHSESSSSASTDEEHRVLRPLIDRVISHYEEYYRTKSRCNKRNVLAMLSPSWTSSLEDAFLWIGGWRPSTAFHLLYSKSGLQLESHLGDLISGLSANDLADLSPIQLTTVDELQRKTIREERDISEKMAKVQESVADSSMVELSHVVTEMVRRGELNQSSERVESTLESKEEELEKIVESADDLRLRTLKSVIVILYPIQAIQFLIAAAELHLRLHEWGLKRDASQRQLTHTGEDQ